MRLVHWRRRATLRHVIVYWVRLRRELAGVCSFCRALLDGDLVDAIASESLDDGEHCYVHEELEELGHSEDGAAEPQTEDAANI